MELRQLRYFVALAEERHFGRAAERLHIAQPGLSQQIKALERSVGAVLFDREARPVALTGAGERLLPYARSMVESASRAAEAIRGSGSGPPVVLKIGLPPIGHYPEFAALAEVFREREPGVEVHLVPAMTPATLAGLSARSLDVGVVHQPVDWHEAEALRYLRLGDRELLVVLPADHALAGRERLPRADLVDEPFVHSPQGLWPELVDHIQRQLFGVAPHPRAMEIPEAFDTDSRIRLVARGQGISAISVPAGSELPSDRDGVAFRRVEDPLPVVEYGVAWLEANASPATRSFVELAQQHRHPAAT